MITTLGSFKPRDFGVSHGCSQSEAPMSIYDILMLLIFVGSVLFGAWKGLAWQVASLSAIIVSYLVAMNFSEPLAALLQAEPPWNKFGAMLILFLGTSLIIWMIFGRISASIKKMHLASFDRQAGALLGAVKGALLCMVVTMFSVSLLGNSTAEAICYSKSGGYITRGINQLSTVVPDEIHGVLGPYIDKFNDAMQQEHLGHEQKPPLLESARNSTDGRSRTAVFLSNQSMAASKQQPTSPTMASSIQFKLLKTTKTTRPTTVNGNSHRSPTESEPGSGPIRLSESADPSPKPTQLAKSELWPNRRPDQLSNH